MLRRLLPLLLLASLACSVLSPAGPGGTLAPTAAPTPAYLGQFDCYGAEGGLGAYAGRLTFQPGGAATFKDYDAATTTGAWKADAAAGRLSFSGSLPLASARYAPATDTLDVTLAPNAALVHGEGGRLQCERARPGITGPP